MIIRNRFIQRALILAILSAVTFACGGRNQDRPKIIKLDYAYYNPLSLLLRDRKYLEEELAAEGIQVEWVYSAGSNKSLEMLNSRSIDFGSTAGVAALLSKANGTPIKTIYVCSKPEWTALVVQADSPVTQISDLKGKRVAVTRGTDPHVFLLRALDRFGLTEKDIELVPLQHPDGKNALEKGDVAAWSGLDPLMGQTEVEKGSRLFFRDPDANTYDVLSVREDFARQYPRYVEPVLKAYEKARKYALEHPDELKAILAREAKLTPAIAEKVLQRTGLGNPVIGEEQKRSILAAGDVLKKSRVIPAETDVNRVLDDLIDAHYIQQVVKL